MARILSVGKREMIDMDINEDSFKIDDTHSIFTYNEIKNIVKGFTNSWLRGDVKIEFPTAQELLEHAKFEKNQLDAKTATVREVQGKEAFKYVILKCCGAPPTTPEELKKSILELFTYIMSYRLGNRIEGHFMQYNLEERILNLEEGISKTNDLVKQIIDWLWKQKVD